MKVYQIDCVSFHDDDMTAEFSRAPVKETLFLVQCHDCGCYIDRPGSRESRQTKRAFLAAFVVRTSREIMNSKIDRAQEQKRLFESVRPGTLVRYIHDRADPFRTRAGLLSWPVR